MGFGAEIAARVAENVLGSLDAPVIRVAAKDTFVPNAANLEALVLPAVDDLRRGETGAGLLRLVALRVGFEAMHKQVERGTCREQNSRHECPWQRHFTMT